MQLDRIVSADCAPTSGQRAITVALLARASAAIAPHTAPWRIARLDAMIVQGGAA